MIILGHDATDDSTSFWLDGARIRMKEEVWSSHILRVEFSDLCQGFGLASDSASGKTTLPIHPDGILVLPASYV